MKRLTSLMIAMSFTLVFDKAFNQGDLTVKLFDNAADARHWVVQSGEDVASTMTGFSS
jgi:hypothetical protein